MDVDEGDVPQIDVGDGRVDVAMYENGDDIQGEIVEDYRDPDREIEPL